jgi:hypothetical protein
METATEKTPVQVNAYELAEALLNQMSTQSGKPILDGDENAEKVIGWCETVADRIVTMIGGMALPDLPLAKRERVTMERLFHIGYTPHEITAGELEDARYLLNEAAAIEPLDQDELELEADVIALGDTIENGSYSAILVERSCADDKLSGSIPYNLPDWINDNVDWDDLYRKVLRDCREVDVSFGSYILMDGIE